jgi:hypothetical protein
MEYTFYPLLDSSWVDVGNGAELHASNHSSRQSGLILDATREVRVKIYMGKVRYSFIQTTYTFVITDDGVGGSGVVLVHTCIPYFSL